MILKRIVRIIVSIIGLIAVASSCFYFWASSSNYSIDQYSKVIENDFSTAISNDSVYSIITYNIGYLSGMTNNLPIAKPKSLFDANLEIVTSELTKVKADIICLQEIDYASNRSHFVDQQDEIAKLGYKFIFQSVNWDINYLPFPYLPISMHFGEVYSGQSIISKYPIKDPERVVLERVENAPFYIDAFYLDRLAQVSKVIIDSKPVIIINVHLEAFDKITRDKQAQHIKELFNLYKDKLPVLLVGDFNSDGSDQNSSIQTILDIPGIKSAVPANEKTYPADKPINRLDYILYNEEFIEMKQSKVLTSFGTASDHLPVLMEFKLK